MTFLGHCEGDRGIEWFHRFAINSVGGILCVWQKESLEITNLYMGFCFLLVEGVCKEGSCGITIVNAYSLYDLPSKRSVWEEIKKRK